ncbi:adenylyl-sulfate kinase [Selenomonas sp. FC4001]|uniref:adenylyl-sulfate kinase n=1 Tax=Selenomonas sp. FC4001 TaxID=1408313 RepID=UPI000565E74A|nr:adenylyl-sulfate kinase [Selenomonas sp. FC4001]
MKNDSNKHGRVYWITGLSGSGKTTIGNALYYELKKTHDNVIILDGDLLKLFVGEKVGYAKDDRFKRAKKYSKLCKILADQGLWVIICTVAMFDEVRSWNRDNITGYIEIFLDVPMDVLVRRDKKGLYSKLDVTSKDYVVGINDNVEWPKQPDIVINNDGSISVKHYISDIISLVPKNDDEYDRDRAYWNKIYSGNTIRNDIPSNFAKYVYENYISKRTHRNTAELLEIGCGNGRDSLYFINEGLHVTGIDASECAIDKLNDITSTDTNALFICDDFVKCQAVYQCQYDYIYSRFTLHAINDKQQSELFNNISTAIKPGGLLFIEARTINDDLYGKGTLVGKNAYLYNDHYRRFINKNELEDAIKKLGFEILYLDENTGFSKTETSDPVLLRVIARNENADDIL